MSSKERIFHLSAEEVSQILICDDSDTEDALPLDQEDVEFLEEDLEQHLQSSASEEVIEVAIETQNFSQTPAEDEMDSTHSQRASSSNCVTDAATDTNFSWKELSTRKQKQVAEKLENRKDINPIQYGQILLDFDSDEETPYQVFDKLAKFDSFITDIVIPQTVLYCQQKGHVLTTTVEEMKAFFGMNIVMGYHKLPSIRDYWSSDPDLSVPYIANVMPLKRFEELRAFLHFNDNDMMLPKDNSLHDRAFKVRPVLDHFNKCFLNGISPTKQQSIDEHMVKFKGRNILKQYVKGKPVQWGFKVWCRCDSKSGYLFQFDLYTGKKTGHVEHGLGEGVVLSLTEQIQSMYCEVYIDNFFNSSQLQYNLLKRGILSAGTVRLNRKNLPRNDLPEDKAMNKGDMVCFESNEIYFTKWMDCKAVHMLSNFLATQPVQDVHRKKKGSSAKQSIKCPYVIQQYNQHMGGVDLMDQKKVTYQFDRRSKYKYYLRLVHDIIDIAINNAGILFNRLNKDSEQLDQKTYRRIVARCLIGRHTTRKRSVPSSSILTPNRAIQLRNCRDSVRHTMQKADQRKRCKLCTSNNMCVECNVHLCYVKGRNCFARFHC